MARVKYIDEEVADQSSQTLLDEYARVTMDLRNPKSRWEAEKLEVYAYELRDTIIYRMEN